MRVLALGLMAFALSACGTETAWSPMMAIEPTGKPPAVQGVSDGPPAAWVETAQGARWLGYSSFCWGQTCADYSGARCGDGRTPTLYLTRDEVIRFHLAFAPSEVTITRGRPPAAEPLETVQNPTWRVRAAGALTLFTRAQKGGDASYTACARFD